ncbi:MAG: NUDIX hydrolase [Bacteroidales bacterium]|nr:NUDIX hydrolase [Bacteroidales bacterium]MCF8387152.1 NUDIX hydrolase [Bacteroidales bacterium]MCF8397634.1 NUDIX hydrolase [Bacteroidales bacterium]
MTERKRKYCPYCGAKTECKMEGETKREFCNNCQVFFYDNPLPVASNIVIRDREILLVKRKFDPFRGYWCLPMGFAESGESIEHAALRELQEEAGIKGRILSLVNVESGNSNTYGDLLYLTFETEWIGRNLRAGDDAGEVGFFPLDNLPEMAFQSNINAIEKWMRNKKEYWAIVDSFKLSVNQQEDGPRGDFLSDKLIRIVENNADVIAGRWMDDVRNNKSTPSYARANTRLYCEKNKEVIRQFGKWLGGCYSTKDIQDYYEQLGRERKQEGFALSEMISALSLTRKHIWEFALSQKMWNKTIDIYTTLELERRMMLFFDKASYYVSRGYEV